MFGRLLENGEEWSIIEWNRKMKNGIDNCMLFYCLGV